MWSATYKLQLESIVIPNGPLNWATVAEPSTNPAPPWPANVEIFPDWSILRILWLSVSARYTLPLKSKTVLYGLYNFPFIKPILPSPAIVLVV